MASQVVLLNLVPGCGSGDWELDSLACLLEEEPACVVLGRLHSPRPSPEEEGYVKLLLSFLCLGNYGKDFHKFDGTEDVGKMGPVLSSTFEILSSITSSDAV